MKQTPLYNAHVALGAKMVEFAGYYMPIQYETGVMGEHNATREQAGLFDVSHMGQLIVSGARVVDFLEKITPCAFASLDVGGAKYSVLTNDDGGIIDDMIVTRMDDTRFFVVVNGACKEKDLAWLTAQAADFDVVIDHLATRALLALQGPHACTALEHALSVDLGDMPYMAMQVQDDLYISRLGYTGEDGFEISMPQEKAEEIWNILIADDAVTPVGLAARDSLRLEMGYPLYGQDIDDTTSPVEAGIGWIMRGREDNNFFGAQRILQEKQEGVSRKRVGIRLTGKGVARAGAEVFIPKGGEKIGTLTSGGFSPTMQAAIGQAYIKSDYAAAGTAVVIQVRGRAIDAVVEKMPFVTAKTKGAVKKAA